MPPRPKIPSTDHPTILDLYQKGKHSASQIAERYGVHCSTITGILGAHGVEITSYNGNLFKKGVRILTDGEKEKIIAEYTSGKTTPELREEMGLTNAQIQSCLRKAGVQLRPRGGVPKALDHSAFDVLTDDVAYWIGMLADGCISDTELGKTRRLFLNLQAGDVEHIEKFKAFVKSDHTVQFVPAQEKSFGGDQYRIAFSSYGITERLISYGITPRKSLTMKVDPRLERNSHFLRGLVDANGSVYHPERRFYISSGSEAVVLALDRAWPGGLLRKKDEGECWVLSYYGDLAVSMLRLMYDNDRPALNRKREAASKHWQ